MRSWTLFLQVYESMVQHLSLLPCFAIIMISSHNEEEVCSVPLVWLGRLLDPPVQGSASLHASRHETWEEQTNHM